MTTSKTRDELPLLIPEILPPDPNPRRAVRDPQPTEPIFGWRERLMTGLVLDIIDLVFHGALGLKLGFPFGLVVGYRLAKTLHWHGRKKWMLALFAGLYCLAPGTKLIPLGTMTTMVALILGSKAR